MEVERQKYFDVKLSGLPDLFAAFILGQDFMGQHKSICVKFGGKRPSLIVCRLTTFSIILPQLFADLAENCKPITVKSRKKQ